MEQLIQFKPYLPSILLFVGWTWACTSIGLMMWRRRQRGLVFPKADDPAVVFCEKFASGASHKSWVTRLGGASNCLTILVADSHLAVTTFFPFTAFAAIYDLEHLIPLSDLTDVTVKRSTVEVEFENAEGGRRRITLRLRNRAQFLKVLGR